MALTYGSTHPLDEIALETLDESGKVPTPSRLSSASALRGLYNDLIKDDEASAIRRTQIQGMKDGVPPYNQAALNAAGQGSRANANFLLGQDLVTKANNGYIDMVTSVKHLVTIDVDGGDPVERPYYNRVIATELTRTIRKWSGFIPRFLQLVDLFTTHGVGIAYFPDTRDFRFEVTGFGDFLIPRQTRVGEDNVLYAVARKDMTVVELYDPIQNEEAATKLGWNVPAVKLAIGNAVTKSSQAQIGDYEKFHQQIKNNDIQANRQFSHVPILHAFVKEFDGSISYFITERDNPGGDFLNKEYSRYKSSEEAFIFFCYGIGNGTYHGIRGMGHMIFALVQLHNRMMCQKADNAMAEDSILVQSATGNALQEISLNFFGPFGVLSPGLDIVDRKMSGGSDRTMPLLHEVKGLLQQTSSRFNAPEGGRQQPGTYENRDATAFNMENSAAGDSGAIDLFYLSLDRIIRQVVKRIIQGPKSDPLVAEFHRRCEKAGVGKDILDSVDHDNTYAYRALGAGSPAARSLTFRNLLQILPQLDEIGRRNLIYEFVADLVGYQNADYFASKSEDPRQNTEAGIATLENYILAGGQEVPVLDYQMDGMHVQIHLPHLLQMLDAVERGEIDPLQNLQALQASLNHLAAHGENLARDPSQKALYGQVKEAVNNLQQVVTNMERKIKAAQRQAAEQGGGEMEGAPQGPSDDEVKAQIAQTRLALEQFKLDLAQRKGELELAAIQAKAEQNYALNDAKNAVQAEMKLRYPRSDAGQRA